TDIGFKTKPDLILLDGGKGHISAAKGVLSEMGLNIPLFGMVKDSKHRTRAIAKSGGEISISANKSVFALVTSIQDEVHRFAITFQRATHKKKTFSSQLTNINGVGEVTAKAIMQKFGSISAVSEATEDELSQVKGVSAKTAKAICDYFRTVKG
ncbi:MAG: excinuclease ABC subunit UvrC, partial [Oscillospiraceae bacterium]|nr:excinuclease ABC subunit UvrC [Oscillospiraceae bacterium]